MSDWTAEQVMEAWDFAKTDPYLMEKIRRRERIKVPLRRRISDLAGMGSAPYDRPLDIPYVEFSGNFEQFDPEGGSYWVVRSGWHVVATEWVTKDTPTP